MCVARYLLKLLSNILYQSIAFKKYIYFFHVLKLNS